MEHAKNPLGGSPHLSSPNATAAGESKQENKNGRRTRPPTPEEVLAYYQSQGLDAQSASLKAIADLQTLLLRGGARGGSAASRRDFQRKLDNINTRVAILDMKLDSKPGYPESLAIGLAAGGFLHGLSAALPPALRALADAWRSVTSAATSHPTSS
ncbi:hypothetical protein AXF42_Ash012425 [Apostasia shenzhenica]|uniref:Uncharacterized protein n=1 Tax=Apostasia shenzhenica TaxID=1088818 RepID=A0A2I0AQZ1_9ASPA|nr:hypothetical protein AXF42_Ash012425 [Apostasia shenzhenica]